MREADWVLSRRNFLFKSAGISAGIAVGITAIPDALEWLERSGPRRLLVTIDEPLTAAEFESITSILPKLLAQGLFALRQNARMPALMLGQARTPSGICHYSDGLLS